MHGISAERYDEEVYIRSLPKVADIVHFQFTVRASVSQDEERLKFSSSFEKSTEIRHFNLLPKPLVQIFGHFGLDDISLTFSKGDWKPQFGPPLQSAPSGVQISGWLPENEEDLWAKDGGGNDTQSTWKFVTRALSGLLCVSMEDIQGQHTVKPWRHRYVGTRVLRYAQLPREAFCTENLTPWLKLLPCREVSGLATIFDPKRVFRALHQTMGLSLRKVCLARSRGNYEFGSNPWGNCEDKVLELVMAFTVVFPPSPLIHGGLKSISNVLLQKPNQLHKINVCTAATTTKVLVEEVQEVSLSQAPTEIHHLHQCGDPMRVMSFELLPQRNNLEGNFSGGVGLLEDITWREVEEKGKQTYGRSGAPVEVNKFVTGVNDLDGGVMCVVRSRQEGPHVVRVLDIMPSFLRVWYHTLELEVNGVKIDSKTTLQKYISFQPSRMRGQPALIHVEIPTNSPMNFSFFYSFRKDFLSIEDYPPDPNRGFDVPAAIVSYDIACKEDNDNKVETRSTTSPLLGNLNVSPGR